MTTFRTSITARMVSLSIAFALTGTGLIPIAGLSWAHALPVVFLIAVAGCIAGLLLGVNDHPGPVALLALLLPLGLWPFTMVAMLAATRVQFGWALIAAGAVVLFSTVAASFIAAPAEAPSASSAAPHNHGQV